MQTQMQTINLHAFEIFDWHKKNLVLVGIEICIAMAFQFI